MKLEDFNYNLPKELIAQTPYLKRDEARLLVVGKDNENFEDKKFSDVLEYMEKGDVLVLNETKVIPARLYGKKETGAFVEILLLKNLEEDIWEAMVRPGAKLKVGAKAYFFEKDLENADISENILEAEILDILEDGLRKVRFKYNGIFNEILDKIGTMPLPPYIHEKLEERDRYQTVYAKHNGSAAAPTAGLHFTDELLKELQEKGVKIARVTLHVGLGTFRPVKVDNVLEHKMHDEYYEISEESVEIINTAKENGNRIFAVGTTSVRTLETVYKEYGKIVACKGNTDIFIYPGFEFKVVDCLITNFHLPKSTLIMLVSAFASKEIIMNAYNEATKNKYRFFSFGDAMLIKKEK